MYEENPEIRSLLTTKLILAFALVLLGCQAGMALDRSSDGSDESGPDEEMIEYQADLRPLRDSGVSGTVSFRTAEGTGHVQVQLTADGLGPGKHSQHIHRNAECPTYGPVLMPLDPFPRAGVNGTIHYHHLGIEKPSDLADRTVVLRAADGVPVACGAINPVRE